MCAGRLDEPGQQRPADPLQRRLPGVGGPQLEGGDAEPVPALLGQVDDEALVGEHPQQVVDAGPGECQVAGDGGRGLRLGVPGEQAQHGEGVGGCRCVGHAPSVSDPRQLMIGAGGARVGCSMEWGHGPLDPGHRHRRHRSALRGRGRRGRPSRRSGDGGRRCAGRHPGEPRAGRRAGRRRRAALRHLHRVRRPGQPAHPGRAAPAAAGLPGALALRRHRPRGRARGRTGADAAAPLDAGHRPYRSP